MREKGGSSTRKLVGHSGPVFATAFDSVGGTAAPPKYLLSASADHTTRLWSLETLTNVVAYRGHRNPVWDVHWSPMGTYFATASRDRTARLWSTERINALRVFAGHLSDVDVSVVIFMFGLWPPVSIIPVVGVDSVSGSTLILCTWQRGPAIRLVVYGMSNAAPVCVFLLATLDR